MKFTLATMLVLVVLVFPGGSCAVDAGSVTGTLTVGSDVVTLKHAYAHLHDNAEEWLDSRKEMRILVSDRDVPQQALSGLNPFFTLSAMVRDGAVRGVLIRFDPAKPNSILVTVLYPPKDENSALGNRTISDSGKSPLENLKISDLRVGASVNQSNEGNSEFGWPSENYSFTFSAPLFREPPVTAILKDRQALSSPQVKAVLAKAEAMKRGDFEAVRKYSTKRSAREMEKFLSQAKEEAGNMMRESGREGEQSVKNGRLRLTVRGDRATLVVDAKGGRSMFGLVKTDGQWLVE